jgi:hypothetical protein
MKKNGYLNYYAKERARTHTIDGAAQLYDRTAVATRGEHKIITSSAAHQTSVPDGINVHDYKSGMRHRTTVRCAVEPKRFAKEQKMDGSLSGT